MFSFLSQLKVFNNICKINSFASIDEGLYFGPMCVFTQCTVCSEKLPSKCFPRVPKY